MRPCAMLALAVLCLGPPPVACAGECSYSHPDLAQIPARGARIVVLPPRAEIVDRKGREAVDAPDLAALLGPEIRCRLEDFGHEVDALSLANDTLAEDAGMRQLVARTWEAFDRRTALLCVPDAPLNAEALTLWETAAGIAAPLRADALVLVRARTLLKSKGVMAFIRTLKAVSPDATWSGPETDITWVEIALVDGSSGRLLALAGVAEEGAVSKHPAQIVALGIDRALGTLPAAGSGLPASPSRVVQKSTALTHWQRGTGVELGRRATRTRPRDLAPTPACPEPTVTESRGTTTIVLWRRAGAPSLLVTNETPVPVRIATTPDRSLELGPGDAVLVDPDRESRLLVVTDLDGRELARADCVDAFAYRLEARIRPR